MLLSLDPQLISATRELLQRAQSAAHRLACATTAEKDAFLVTVASLLNERRGAIAAANREDVQRARDRGRNAAFIDRLTLTEQGVVKLAAAVDEIRNLPDPVGRTTQGGKRPNGLHVSRVTIPLGVIGMIYESRPNVTIDAGCLCIKAGNVAVLRGGSDARHSNAALLQLLRDSLVATGLPADAALAPAAASHDGIRAMVSIAGGLDLVIPRGGTALIDEVNRWARVPVIQHYEGVCHVYVDGSADLDEAVDIVVNAKAQRPGTCNAMEAVLIDRAIAATAVPKITDALVAAGVELRVCAATAEIAVGLPAAVDADFGREFLDMVAVVCIVDGIDGAMQHIRRYGSGHTEAICTRDVRSAQRFVDEVIASCVVVNASTRFNDGGCLGLGAEIGISTSKLHAFGPMGLDSLTTQKYVVRGDGHVRT